MPFAQHLASEAIHAAMALGKSLPRSVALPLFSAGGAAVHLLEGRGRRMAQTNLRHVFGAGTDARALSRQVYRDLGRNVVDLARLETHSGPSLTEMVSTMGWNRLEQALARGRGVIGVTGHIGNWELMASYLGQQGVPLTVLASRLFNPSLDDRLTKLRRRHGVRTLYRSEPGCLRKTLRILDRGEMLGIVMDLRTRARTQGIDSLFLGHPIRTVVGPARLAARSGASILPMACWRTPGDRFRLEIDAPVPWENEPGTNREMSWKETTDRCMESIERYILSAPTQWVWMHDRWGLGVSQSGSV